MEPHKPRVNSPITILTITPTTLTLMILTWITASSITNTPVVFVPTLMEFHLLHMKKPSDYNPDVLLVLSNNPNTYYLNMLLV